MLGPTRILNWLKASVAQFYEFLHDNTFWDDSTTRRRQYLPLKSICHEIFDYD